MGGLALVGAEEVPGGAEEEGGGEGEGPGGGPGDLGPAQVEVPKKAGKIEGDGGGVTGGVRHIDEETGGADAAGGGEESVEEDGVEGDVGEVDAEAGESEPGERGELVVTEEPGSDADQGGAQENDGVVGGEGAPMAADEPETGEGHHDSQAGERFDLGKDG